MPEAAPPVPVKALPRRGRFWVVLVLGLGLFALCYSIVQISTQKPDKEIIHIEGISEAQEIFGGVPQEGDRLGSSDAPVTIQVFNDLQCSSCREAFLATIPTLTEKYGRNAQVKFLYRHYSNAENPIERGFFGAEAAAEQGYGWQYTFLFFRNQDEIKGGSEKRFTNFLDSVAGGVEELNAPEWEAALKKAEEPGSAVLKRLEGYDELGTKLSIRVGQAMIVNGPNGTQTLQDSPELPAIEKAIEEVQ
jgi:protein-disulfide isomerase